MHIFLQADGQLTPRGIFTDPLAISTRSGKLIDPTPAQPRLDMRGYWLLPGLINAHDHLELNHYPRTRLQARYENAHQWGEAISARLHQAPFNDLQAYPLAHRCLIGGLKNLLSGVTTVAHHNPLHRPLYRADFPVDVVRQYGWIHSLHFTPAAEIQHKIRQTPAQHPLMIHLAEGVDTIAAAEYGTFRALGGVAANTVLIHGVGMGMADQQDAIQRGAGLIWCPSTNFYLLGQTATVGQWLAAKRLALGSDSRLTADGDLLDELRAASNTNQTDLPTLLHLVTDWAANLLRLSDRGDLAVGMRADVVAIRRHSDDPYPDLIQARRADIGLVMRAGRVLYGDPSLVKLLATDPVVAVKVDAQPKLLCKQIARQIRQSQLQETGLQFV